MRYRSRPPKNRQNHDNSCWAAALDSFSRVTAGVPTRTERALCAAYGNPANAFGLDAGRLASLTHELEGYGCRVDLQAFINLPYDIEDKLATSHVVIAWQVGPTDWHANLVYGIDNSTISVMETRDGSYKERRWNYYVSPGGFYLIWKP